MTPWRWHAGLSIALVLLALDAPQTWACERWTCGNGRYAYRPAPRAHGYTSPARAYRYWSPAWAYGYTNPARLEGYPYAAWSSISIPQTRSYLNSAAPPPNARAVGLTMPVTSGPGLQETDLPGRGPSLFGPNPPP